MHLFEGTVEQAREELAEPGFFARCAETFTRAQGVPPGDAELRSWRQSWPRLLDTLSAAELHGLHLLLEYELPGCSQRIDALLLGKEPRDEHLVAVAIELKQWSHAQPHPCGPGMLFVGGREVLHPSRQVGRYVNYLRGWLPEELKLDARGLALLHNAPEPLLRDLRRQVAQGPSAHFPLLGSADVLLEGEPEALMRRLLCSGLRPAPKPALTEFLQAPHRPSGSVLARIASQIEGGPSFQLINEQDKAFQEIHRAIGRTGKGNPGHVVVVTGGPGTGKTAIAGRIFADQCRQPGANPRFLSPSGALTQQLVREVGDAVKGLISTVKSALPRGLDKENSVVVFDEAHRAQTDRHRRSSEFPHLFTKLLERCAVLVVFLDEGQTVRPGEGTTLEELRRLAERHTYSFAHVDLQVQFRCRSEAFLAWVDGLLTPDAQPVPWSGTGYDLALAPDPVTLERWVHARIAKGRSARITAGFCWPWKSPDRPPLLPEVRVSWAGPDGPRVWERPWNARAAGVLAGEGVPGRAYWASDEGGEQQVGCVYTAQGLEYEHSAVILGEDLVWDGGWRARPEKSHDPALQGLSPRAYLPYALNTYRVLLTRGSLGTRLHSVDPGTQRFLGTLMPADPPSA